MEHYHYGASRILDAITIPVLLLSICRMRIFFLQHLVNRIVQWFLLPAPFYLLHLYTDDMMLA